MSRHQLRILWLVLLAAGCSDAPGPATGAAEREPATSEVVVRAVDAGTREALVDASLGVRWLVRSPITLDATGRDEVPAGEPYAISLPVSEDSLVVEVRLEAPSYRHVDTVLAVARGQTTGPIDVPLILRGDRVAGASPSNGVGATQPAPAPPGATAAGQGGGGGGGASTAGALPSTGGAGPEAAGAPAGGGGAGAAVDRSALATGDRAFQSGQWRAAVEAYRRMPEPTARDDAYAEAYQQAVVRQGISFINLGEWQPALAALRRAVGFDFRVYTAWFYLGQVECTLGEFAAGRRSLAEVDRLSTNISDAQRPIVSVLVDYQRAMCSWGELGRAGSAQREQLARQALADLTTFVGRAEAMSPVPREVEAALADARSKAAQLR